MSPKDSGAPWSSSNGGGEFGAELKRAQDLQNSKMAAESATTTTSSATTSDTAVLIPPGVEDEADEVDEVVAEKLEPSTTVPEFDDIKTPPPPFEDSTVVESSAQSEPVTEEVEVPELPPGKIRIRALYDYDATQDGDLSFRAGDMIIADGASFSGDGWVSGECEGNIGIFPANYTEPW